MSKTFFHSYFQKLSQLSGIGLTIFASFLFLLKASAQTDSPVEARQLEAKRYISSINKGQQAYYVEYSKFTDVIPELGIGISTETENYSYEIITLEEKLVVAVAIPKSSDLKSYTAGAFLVKVGSRGFTSDAIICESNRPSRVPPSTGWTEDRLICGLGSSPL